MKTGPLVATVNQKMQNMSQSDILWCVDSRMTILLQIYCRVSLWKGFGNQSAPDKVTDKKRIQWHPFSDS